MKTVTSGMTLCTVLRFLAATSYGAGIAYNENFTICTPAQPTQKEGQAFAELVLDMAEQYRREIAQDLLVEELPPGVGRTMISVRFSHQEDAGVTWAKDNPERRYHNVYLTTTPQRALGSTLKHELAHVVLATRFPHPERLPPWLEEGLASRYNDDERKTTHQRIMNWFSRTGNWPRLENILHTTRILADDTSIYATAASLTEYLLSQKDIETLFCFAQAAKSIPLDTALQKYYAIHNMKVLQSRWQAWVGGQRLVLLDNTASKPLR